MDERNTDFLDRQNTFTTLSYIIGSEMLKPMDEMDTSLIEKSIDIIHRIDKNSVPSPSKAETSINDLHSRLDDSEEKCLNIPDPSITDERIKSRKRIPNKIKIIIIAAIISAFIAGIAVYAFTDIFSLFFNDPREKLEWKDGESHSIDNYEMIITSGAIEYGSINEMIASINRSFVFPRELPEDYELVKIYYFPSDSRSSVSIMYKYSGKSIRFKVLFDRDFNAEDNIESSGFETIETSNGNLFYLMESEYGYQGMARIGRNIYIIDSFEKDVIIQFIKNVKEL